MGVVSTLNADSSPDSTGQTLSDSAGVPSSDSAAVTSDFRALPAINYLVDSLPLKEAVESDGRPLVVAVARETLEAARSALRAGGPAPSPEDLADDVRSRLDTLTSARPATVINATGVVLHTNLGRAPVSAVAAAEMARAAGRYTDLEYDLAAGRRGSRHDLAIPLLCHLTGAESALVVNNNAAATLLVLSALAAGRGVIVSRGQLVEIGGGYRIPDVMAAGGARLIEVGTTNRTHPSDYERAIDADTALLMRVHLSNFKQIGFTAEVGLEKLVEIGRAHDLTVVDDLGSGSLIDTARFGLAPEPLVTGSVAAGADLVTFSGDKLLGGPQAGVIVGRKSLIDRLRVHPLTRAMRPDKSTLAGLAATLRHYARGEAEAQVPIWRMIAATAGDLEARAQAWRNALAAAGISDDVLRVADDESAIGGGSLPSESLPTRVLALRSDHPDALAAAMRAGSTPVVARVSEGELRFDPRTVLPEEDAALIDAVVSAFAAVLGRTSGHGREPDVATLYGRTSGHSGEQPDVAPLLGRTSGLGGLSGVEPAPDLTTDDGAGTPAANSPT